MKIKKNKIIFGLIALFALFLLSNMIPIGVLLFTNTQIVQVYFLPLYYAKITSTEGEDIVFKKYMEQKGWKEKNRLGSQLIFEKNGKTIEIFTTQIKTIIKDGKLVFL